MSKIHTGKVCEKCSSPKLRSKYKGGHTGKKRGTWSGAYKVCPQCDTMQGGEKRYTKKRKEE